MGIPKFFRYISERYPCLNVRLREHEIPEIDNFYLDMNGIIHNCSHDDNKVAAAVSEEKIFRDIFYYVELLFRMIKPKKIFMMAVDGVAPRAKMNQQRARRFRAAKDAEDAVKKLESECKEVPKETFDSNCITPGTEFMARLHEQFKYFIAHKISTDKLWQIPKIVYTGHDVPGEGEHKIMDYIRYLKTCEGYDPNTKHCLHGLDADLIMLGLCTHEPNFCILREEVYFTKANKRTKNPEDTVFQLLHLSLLRDYLDLEFRCVKSKIDFEYDLERIIDDWILMEFLVGNDFVPNIPCFYIARNGLDTIYEKYIEVLPSLGGYMNENGNLHLVRFEKFLEALSEWEFEVFKENFGGIEGLDDFEQANKRADDLEKFELEEVDGKIANPELLEMLQQTEDFIEAIPNDEEDSDEDVMRVEYNLAKKRYYMSKFENKLTKEEVLEKAEEYIKAIVWILGYYYNGCPSWSWYYPFHYTPQLSDLTGYSKITCSFPDDAPFRPFDQLLAVLPSASKNLLPKCFQHLVLSEESPIKSFYPTNFELDMEGKQNDWEAIVLLPFIEEKKLLEAVEPYMSKLSLDEIQRNTPGPMYSYCYTAENLGVYKSPGYFPDVSFNHAKIETFTREKIKVPLDKLVRGINPNFKSVQPYGFPRLRHVPFDPSLKHGRVRVFNFNSLRVSMILSIHKREISPEMGWTKRELKEKEEGKEEEDEEPEKEEVIDEEKLKQVGQNLIGQQVFSHWPHVSKALVIYLMTKEKKCFKSANGTIEIEDVTKKDADKFNFDRTSLEVTHNSVLGIKLGQIDIIVYVKSAEGKKLEFDESGKAKSVMNWSSKISAFPYQTIVMQNDLLPKNPDSEPEINEIFSPGQICFFLGPRFYGAKAEILETVVDKNKLKVKIETPSEPDFSNVLYEDEYQPDKFYSAMQLSQMVTMNTNLISRITGVIIVKLKDEEKFKKNIGLNVKLNKANKEVMGYTMKCENKYWKYSKKVATLLSEYRDAFPRLFEYFETSDYGDFCECFDNIYPEDSKKKLEEIDAWIKEKTEKLGLVSLQRVVGSKLLSEETINKMENIISSHREKNSEVFSVSMVVKPSNLYIPEVKESLKCPDPSSTNELLDRVVFVQDFHPIPIGTKGTIVGWSSKEDESSTLYDILFDEVLFSGSITALPKESQVYQLSKQSFINLTHGSRLQNPPKSEELSWRSRNAAGPPLIKLSPNNGLRPENVQENNWRIKGPEPKGNPFGNTYNNGTWRTQTESLPRKTGNYGPPEKEIIHNTRVYTRKDPNANARPEKDNVMRFFDVYRNPKNVEEKPKMAANSEFQSMWSQLKMQSAQEIAPVNPHIEKSVNEQTSVLKKMLKLSDENTKASMATGQPLFMPPHIPQRKTCNHKDCEQELKLACQSIRCPFPSFICNKHNYAVQYTLTFNDRTTVSGSYENNDVLAFSSACCMALKTLESRMRMPTMMAHPPNLPPPFALPYPPQVLPSLPQQWQPKEAFQQKNAFFERPQTFKTPEASKVLLNTGSVFIPINHSPTKNAGKSQSKPSRRRIAANFSNPIDKN